MIIMSLRGVPTSRDDEAIWWLSGGDEEIATPRLIGARNDIEVQYCHDVNDVLD